MSAAVRRLSVIDHGATGTGGSGLHSGGRAALIMTSAHSRRVSTTNFAASAVSRSYENTYKTEPEKAFCPAAARRVIGEVLEGMLEDKVYERERCKQLATSLADAIKKRVKELGFPRYKLVTHVAIGQADDSSVAFASRCVWNDAFDSFAEYTFRNSSLRCGARVRSLL